RDGHIALQADGKIVIAETALDLYWNNVGLLACLTSNGNLDASFGTGGMVQVSGYYTAASTSNVQGLAVQSDGRILVETTYEIFRYNANGSRDWNFYPQYGVMPVSQLRGIALLPDDRILVAAQVYSPGAYYSTDAGLIRLRADGTVDGSFAPGQGYVTVDFGSGYDDVAGVALLPFGRIVLAGRNDGDFAVAQFLPSGLLDKGFGTGGVTTVDFNGNYDDCRAVAVGLDGKIIVGGTSFGRTDY